MGAPVNAYSVYRVDYRSSRTERIGRLVDRRKRERRNNAEDMLRLAQSTYSHSAIYSHIFIIRESSRLRMLFEDTKAPAPAAGGVRS